MAGKYILKLLDEIDSRLIIGNKWLIRYGRMFTVYKKYAKSSDEILIETEDEELACKVLKGESWVLK